MRWTPAHLNPLLVLRGIAANGRWEARALAIWQAVQAASRQAHQGARQQRRRLRLVQAADRRETTAAAVPPTLAAAEAAPVVAAAPPADDRPRPQPHPRRPGRQRPAPDHPWRRLCFGRQHQQAR